MTASTLIEERRIVSPAAEIDTPSMVVDETILHQNIAEMQALANSHGVGLRPHIKTHKTPEIARLQMQAGAIGLTCAKLGEAEVMVDLAGIQEILIAYPVVGEIKIRRLLSLMDRAHMTIAVDTRDAAAGLSAAMTGAERVLDVLVEVNTGQDRAGAHAGEEALALATDIAKMPGLRIAGIMTHEGHASSSEPDQIAAMAIAAGKALVTTANEIRAAGIPLETVSTGSTPSAPYTPTVPGITEMRPGTYVFNDNNAFRHGRTGPNNCAARVLATVVSRPASNRAILDCGSKALTYDPSPSHTGHGYIVGHPGAIIGRVSEEHGVVLLSGDEQGFQVGDRYEVIPNHICPAINLTDELLIVRDGQVIDTWRVAARGKVR